MNWNYESNTITEDMVSHVENILKVNFPEDFLRVMKEHDGGYPTPNKITIDGNMEAVNNLVSFSEDDGSFILDIFEETEYLNDMNLIPIAEDPFGNLFCYDFHDGGAKIVFWNHEDEDEVQFVCDSFTEFLGMLHE